MHQAGDGSPRLEAHRPVADAPAESGHAKNPSAQRKNTFLLPDRQLCSIFVLVKQRTCRVPDSAETASPAAPYDPSADARCSSPPPWEVPVAVITRSRPCPERNNVRLRPARRTPIARKSCRKPLKRLTPRPGSHWLRGRRPEDGRCSGFVAAERLPGRPENPLQGLGNVQSAPGIFRRSRHGPGLVGQKQILPRTP